ncbi:MAB_1171c family putative transporter [Micromonospora sp. MW-13]|uniref:MAB_1171c family putative transporter n=1 Tax=Micromonospora sp. MW-13 TaxID=2094022 RepID=UPI000FFEA111|nr:MAB_1171c family putative transporter [Micromonospora sp. MW-13]
MTLFVACGGAVCYKLWHARRRPGDRSRQALSLAVLALTVGTGIQVGAATVDRVTGLPNTGRMLSNCAGVVAACAALVFLVHLRRPAPGPASRQWWALAVVLPAIVVLFLLSPADPASSRGDPRHATAVYSSPYVYLFLAYLSYVLSRALREAHRCLRAVTERSLRTVFWLTIAGCGTGLLYAFFKFCYLIGHDLGVGLPGNENSTSTPAYLLTIGLLAVAAVTPACRPVMRVLRRWTRRYLAYQRLFPLWRAVYRAAPTVALGPRDSRLRSLLTLCDLEFLLYRRVIEIRDGQLALRNLVPAGTAGPLGVATPASGTDRLVAVLREPATEQSEVGPESAGDDLDAEVRSLERMASRYARLRRAPR